MLIVMAGLPGAGKSTVAEAVARRLGCAVVSVDPIESALWTAGIDRSQPTGLSAYVVADAMAHEQLALGHDVIVDAVNDVAAARQQWRDLAARHGGSPLFVLVTCGDPEVHQQRLAGRVRSVLVPNPTWPQVLERQAGLDEWLDGEDEGVDAVSSPVVVDSLDPAEQTLTRVLAAIEQHRASPAT